MASNGRLPSSTLRGIPGGRLEKAAAASWLRLRAKIGKETGIWICPTSSRTAYRTYSEQVYFWQLFQSGRGALAARPGTSNHGWGTTVDVPTTAQAAAINRYGASYGWQKKWSDAPSEWWHFKYAPANDKHKGEKPAGNAKHPYHYLTKGEKEQRNILVRERRIAKRHGGWDMIGASHLVQAGQAKKKLREAKARIYKAAQKGGWDKSHRRVRYTYIKKLIEG